MEIQIEKLEKLVEKADQILFTPEGEKVLLGILELQEQIELALKKAKANIEKSALKINPDFKSVQGDLVKVAYRSYGALYRLDESRIDQVPSQLYEVTKKYNLLTDEVNKYIDEHKGTPVGIVENERPKTLSISVKKSGK